MRLVPFFAICRTSGLLNKPFSWLAEFCCRNLFTRRALNPRRQIERLEGRIVIAEQKFAAFRQRLLESGYHGSALIGGHIQQHVAAQNKIGARNAPLSFDKVAVAEGGQLKYRLGLLPRDEHSL